MSDIRFNRWLHQSGTGGVSQDSSGNIGIGTTVPTMALDVRGDVNIGNTININNASGIISATTFTGTTGTFSGNISAVDGTFTGDVTIAGTLTYEDVANIDAVGIITAQSDIIVGGGLTVTGISTFNNDVKLLDNDTLKFGIGEDLRIYHDASHSYITNATADLRIRSSYLKLQGSNGENMLVGNQNTNVEIYYDNSKKFETTNTGAVVTGILTATTFSGNLTGNVTGDLTGNLAGISSIAAISASISDTATDVFVYDTRKDSDGGAWRKRTQHTSWYNETLGTATRGSRKEFPAVAVIVAESSTVTIYDGDDPDLPMWMVFNVANNTWLKHYSSGSNCSCVTALNGEMVTGGNGNGIRLSVVRFVHDNGYVSESGYTYRHEYISTRNSTAVGPSDTVNPRNIVNNTVNDVAMTVLPNAPIDDTTELPVPTIAVGTNDGVSIIKDDGNVVDYTHGSSTYDMTSFVEFLSDDRVAYAWDNNNTPRRLFITPILSADTQTVDAPSYPIDSVGSVGYGRPTDNKDVGNYHGHLIGDDQSVAAAMNESMIAVGDGSDGLNLVDIQAAGDDTFNSLVAFATTSYNTGWQYGNIKGTFLSDTDTTNKTNGQTDPDRSVNNNALNVTGTVTKSAVATGAELVAYSGFSASNYLQQPYNSNLNFGTGDFSISVWIYPTVNNSDYKGIISRGSNGVYGPYALSYQHQKIIFVASEDWNETNDGGSWGTLAQSTDGDTPINQWSHIVVAHSGTITKVYRNGVVIATDTSAVNPKAPTTNYIPTMIGAERTPLTGAIGRPWQGSLALLRASASAPSPEQIKKIYEDEKVLFQENSKATLYGSSDAVTALGYDEDTELLHVGTSAGRSDFQGLRRINNTTTAVTTAISASDDLIAEQ